MGRKKNRQRKLPGLIVPAEPAKRTRVGAVLANMRGRIIAGLLLALPFVVTFWIVYWLYATLDIYFFSPISRIIVRVTGVRQIDALLPEGFTDYVSPVLGLITVGVLLYFLGFFARSRLVRLFDTFLLRVPIVTSIYSAASRMFQSLGGTGEISKFKRVVLVSFPHLGMRVPAFVTSSCRDVTTGRTILCVYVPTTPIPTSGYMVLVPEEDVSDLDWSLEETIQAVVSFGLTAPQEVQYFPPNRPEPKQVEEVKGKS